ncbi:MAG: DUF3854 domain-containing protein [Nostoc indistinguendum CM1-VF10]|jgi:hypothetical protein|nr:DUF3854 domain-containing protein [Nostoc indistinguendum CM1-VF10]
MFDERHLQLSSAYAKSSEYFARAVIAPYLKFVLDSIGLAIDDEINKRLKLSIGQEAYVMTPDGNGGWKWHKIDPQTEEFNQAEFEEFEELLTELLTPLLPSSGEIPLLPSDNTDPLLPGSNTPPKLSPSDSPPLLPPSDTPPFLPNSATPVELVAIPIAQEADSINWQEAESRGAQKQKSREEEEQTSEEETCTSFFPPAQKPPSPVPLPLLTSRIDIDPNHWQELVEGSGIAPEIVELNFKSLHLDPIEQEHEAWEYLMYSKKLERINTGRLSTGMLNKYSHLEDGGWWCNAGVDPRSFASLQPSQKPTQKLWGCYKPNNKRENVDNPGKFIKYEHPPKTGLSIFLLDVPMNIARQIYESAGVEPSISDRTSGFWYCVWKHNVPVTLTEGAKKAASLLSQGEAAIGLPGIYAGYRSKDGLGNEIVPVLHDELAVFATSNRDIKICFDYETRYKTKRNINIATSRTGQLLSDAGAQVSVVELPGPEKGVDDLIVVQGVEACKQVLMASVPLDDWIKKNQPPDLRLTVFLKNGEQIHLYEQLGDGTVNLSPSRESVEEEQTIAFFGKTRSKLSIIQPTDLITTPESSSQNIGGQVIDAEVLADESKEEVAPAQNASLPLKEVSVHSFDSWARREQVKQYQQNFFRKRLEARENKEIASVAYALVKNYGVEKDGNLVYQADAFTIIKSGNNYSIHRRADETLALMQFYADKWGAITLSEQPKDMFPIERQEFLLVADYLKSGKQLPSVDEDPRKIANTLGSLSLNGTHTILESFKTSEILQILTQTLKRTGCDDLELGNYRILYQKSQLDTTSTLQLLKTEHTGATRAAASFEFSRTDSGMTHQLKTLAITEQDIAKLRLLAQKLDIQQPAKEATANPHATRDIEVPIHPKIAKLWQDLENRQQKSNSVPYTAAQVEQNFLSPDSTFDLASNSQDINLQPANTVVAKPIKKTSTSQHQLSKSDIESIPLPLHPLLCQYWQDLEDNHRWADIAKQENTEFRLKIQSNGKLSIGEQRELYNKLLIHSIVEQSAKGLTNISLPPLNEIIQDLISARSKVIHNTYTPKVEVYSQKSQKSHHKAQSNSAENEL